MLFRLNAKRLTLSFALLLLIAGAARAETIQLNVGSTASITTDIQDNVFQLNASATNFQITYSNATLTTFPFVPFSFPLNSLSGSGQVVYEGVAYSFFRGGVGFDSFNLSGNVVAYASPSDLLAQVNPILSLTFAGRGILRDFEFGSTLKLRVFTVAIPEPATMLLLGSGLARIAAVRGRKRERY